MPKLKAVVIGSGAGGAFAAMELCKNGVEVTLLERGKQYAAKDFQMNHDHWELQIDPLKYANDALFDASINTPTIPFEDIDITSQDWAEPLFEKTQTQPKNIRRGRFVYHRVLGLGGSTLHYQGEAHRFGEHAFQCKHLFGWGEDWPIDYAELAPFYEQAENILGVAGVKGNPFKSDRGAFPTPAHALSKKSQLAKIGSDKLGWQLLPNTLALPSVSYDGRLPCQHSGGCVKGCIFGAKSSVDLTALKIATATGNLSIITEARALKLNHNSSRIVSVDYLHHNERLQMNADIFILAAGAIETPRLMLHSKSDHFTHGLGNQHDQVGRNFMETIVAAIMCKSTINIDAYQGPPLDSRVWDFYYPNVPLKTGYVMGVAGTLGTRLSPHSYALSIKGFGQSHLQQMVNEFGNDIQFYGVAEQIPDENNRITLSDGEDKEGVPLVNVFNDYCHEDKKTLREMIQNLKRWAEATPGISQQSLYSSYSNPSATHVGGTCRMGSSAKKSVTDGYGKVHDLDNLFITDASVMPSQGAGDSPSLTISALAIRTAQNICKSIKN